jgi:glycosyltransferase involved in cell wall biosynthesis
VAAEPRARLAIIGAYPPPYGGVTVHVLRLRPLLERAGVPLIVYNACSDFEDGRQVRSVWRGRSGWMLRYLVSGPEPAVYFLSGRLSTWLAAAWLKVVRSRRVMVRLQNASLIGWMRHSAWRRALAGLALRRLDGVVCVSEALREAVLRLGVAPDRAFWFPGFLPPVEAELREADLAEDLRGFLESFQPVLAANGKVAWHAGEDLYGLDLLVDLLARLKPDFPRIGLVFCFSDLAPADRPYLEKVRARADTLGVAGQLLLRLDPGHFLPVLRRATVFVRPTSTDGDANSVREALFLGIPVVASDAAARPEGTELFRSRDLDHLERAVRRALARQATPSAAPETRLSPADRSRIEAYVRVLVSLAG